MRGAVRARRRSNRLPLLLGGIVVAFMLAFFSLAQTVRVAATGYDINRLLDEQQSLLDRKQELLSDLNRLGSEPAIRQQALEAGLGQLTDPLVLTGN
jgi:Tfp pilus assembly protein PilN